MIKLEIINPVKYPKWDELLLSSSQYSFFHSSYWARVLYDSYHYRPLYFNLVDNGSLLVSLPLMEIKSILTGQRGVSLPFSDSCDPIIDRDIQFRDVFDCLIKYGKKAGWKFIELKGGQDFLEDSPPSLCYYYHTLNLSKNEKQVLSNFRSSTRRNIRKSITEGVTVNLSLSLESLKEFYGLQCITRKMHGLPPQPYYFFKKIYDHIISKEHGFVVNAYFKGRAIAGAVYFHSGGQALFKYGASNKKYHYLRPNNLVMWEAIRWYCLNGYKSLCFGKTEPENKGLLQFKTGWGTDEKIMRYYKYDLNEDVFIKGKSYESGFHNRIFKKMPIPLLKSIGSLYN
jgi:hypothetical protein